MTLRDYQIKAVEEVRSSWKKSIKRLILCLPTGSGKTVIFSYIAKKTLEKGNSVLVITNRKELLTQAGGTFEKFGIVSESLTAETKSLSDCKCYVGMVETLHRRLDKKGYKEFLQSFNLIIIDECHINSFNKLFDSFTENQFIIGATATPLRQGNETPLSKYYDSIVGNIQISELIKNNYLAMPVTFGVSLNGLSKVGLKGKDFDSEQVADYYDKIRLYEGVIKNYRLYTNNQKAILFAANVKSSKKICQQLKISGYASEHLDANTPDDERKEILNRFKSGQTTILCNVGILTAGFDVPDIQVVIIYRATRSIVLWLQMVGRGSRVTENKKAFTILDFGENIKRLGFWEQKREWSLENQKAIKKQGEAPVKTCGMCGAYVYASAKECMYCSYVFPPPVPEQTEKEVFLTRLDYTERATGSRIADLVKLAKQKKYNIYWVARQCKTKEELKVFAKFVSKDKWQGWYYFNKSRYGF